jgi:hypothetical protein
MTTTPEDADALFDLATPAVSPPPAPATANANATATATAPPGDATPSSRAGLPNIVTELRKEQRVKVSWPARVQLANGRVVELRVRDLSDGGVGLLTPVTIPSGMTLNFAMGVPALDDPARLTPVTGTLRTTYSVLQGSDIHCGGTWAQLAPEARELLDKWIRKLAR